MQCSNYTNCENCTYGGCIWCGINMGCNGQFSSETCTSSQSCSNLTNCFNKNPQSLPLKDYTTFEPIVIIVTPIICLILLTILWTLFCKFKKFDLFRKYPKIRIRTINNINNIRRNCKTNKHLRLKKPYSQRKIIPPIPQQNSQYSTQQHQQQQPSLVKSDNITDFGDSLCSAVSYNDINIQNNINDYRRNSLDSNGSFDNNSLIGIPCDEHDNASSNASIACLSDTLSQHSSVSTIYSEGDPDTLLTGADTYFTSNGNDFDLDYENFTTLNSNGIPQINQNQLNSEATLTSDVGVAAAACASVNMPKTPQIPPPQQEQTEFVNPKQPSENGREEPIRQVLIPQHHKYQPGMIRSSIQRHMRSKLRLKQKNNILKFKSKSIFETMPSIMEHNETHCITKCHKNCNKFCLCTVIFSTIFILAIGCIVCIFFPRDLKMTTCSPSSEWATIWTNYNHGQYSNSYLTLLTITNNNYFSIKIEEIGIRFYYESYLIGYKYPNQSLYLPSHTNNDILSQIIIVSSDKQMSQMYKKWINDSLSIKIEFSGTGNTYFLNTNFLLYSSNFDLNINNLIQGKTINDLQSQSGCSHTCPYAF